MHTGQLISGYINRVYRENGYIVKEYVENCLMGEDPSCRLQREEQALKHFDGSIAPHFIKTSENKLYQEDIQGTLLSELARNNMFEVWCKQAGRLLHQIHEPISNSISSYYDYRDIFENQIKQDVQTIEELLIKENIEKDVKINWDIVNRTGIRKIHGDFHLGNIMVRERSVDNRKLCVIDWETYGVGSPYEDFAYVDLWISRQYNMATKYLYQGYGEEIDKETIFAFRKAKAFQNLARTIKYSSDDVPYKDFYRQVFIDVLREERIFSKVR